MGLIRNTLFAVYIGLIISIILTFFKMFGSFLYHDALNGVCKESVALYRLPGGCIPLRVTSRSGYSCNRDKLSLLDQVLVLSIYDKEAASKISPLVLILDTLIGAGLPGSKASLIINYVLMLIQHFFQ